MLTVLFQEFPEIAPPLELRHRFQQSQTLSQLVLMAWQSGLWFAQQKLEVRTTVWGTCSVCGRRLQSKGFASRQVLTLVGRVQWRRRVGRCPERCRGRQQIPLDKALGLAAYQQISRKLQRLGGLLALFLPFGLAAWLLAQLSSAPRRRWSKTTLLEWRTRSPSHCLGLS